MIKEREQESKQLIKLIDQVKNYNKSETVYVNGVPGSGKTYMISKVLTDNVKNHIFINCAKLRTKKQVFAEIMKKMKCFNSSKLSIENLRKHFSVCKEFHCIFLDEFDMLLTKKNSFLYNIFDFTHIEKSKIMLIVAANTMDIHEKMIDAKIRSRMGDNRINFQPYNHKQLKNIMIPNKRYEADAVELLTRKIGAVSGDCRKFFRILKIAENNCKNKITVKDIINAMEEQSKPIFVKFLQNLCIDQKFIIYLLKSQYDVEINVLFEKMKFFHRKNNLDEIEYFDFLNCVESLNSYGIISRTNKKGIINIKNILLPEEIETALKKDPDYNEYCGL